MNMFKNCYALTSNFYKWPECDPENFDGMFTMCKRAIKPKWYRELPKPKKTGTHKYD